MKPALAIFETNVRRVEPGTVEREFADVLAVEEPLEIRLGLPDGTHKAISITMRTPGEDAELVYLAGSRADAETWLQSHRYPNAFLEEVTADAVAADVAEGRTAA